MTESKTIRFDGLGILFLGLAVLLAVVAAVLGILKPSIIEFGCAADCLDRRDLDAQSTMAWAAWAMVAVSVATGLVGALSLLLINRTLEAAQRSAIAAEKAVEQAVATTAETRRLGRAQYRAYLAMTYMEFSISSSADDLFEFTWSAVNTGQSPAKDPRLEIIFELHAKRDDEWWLVSTDNCKRLLADLPVNATETGDFLAYLPDDKAITDAWEKGAVRVEVTGAMFFVDILESGSETILPSGLERTPKRAGTIPSAFHGVLAAVRRPVGYRADCRILTFEPQ